MKKSFSLQVQPRTATGHGVSSLRALKLIPAVVYGNGFASTSVAVDLDVFTKTYSEAGETHVVDLLLEGKSLPVLIHAVQTHPVTQKVVHVEFLKVNLKEKMRTTIPVAVEGEAPAVKDKLGNLLLILSEVEIEALPGNIPESLIVDVSSLTEVDAERKVSDLIVPSGVSVITDANETVVKIGALVVESEPAADTTIEQPEETNEGGPTTEQPAAETN